MGKRDMEVESLIKRAKDHGERAHQALRHTQVSTPNPELATAHALTSLASALMAVLLVEEE